MSLLYEKAFHGTPLLLLGYDTNPLLRQHTRPFISDHILVFKPHIPATWSLWCPIWMKCFFPQTWSSRQLSHQLPQEDTLCPTEDLVPLLRAPAASKHTCLNTHHKEIQYPFIGQSPPLQDPGWQEWSFVLESSLITWEFPASPVPWTRTFHDKGYGFDPWLGNWDCTCQKKKYESSLIINHA